MYDGEARRTRTQWQRKARRRPPGRLGSLCAHGDGVRGSRSTGGPSRRRAPGGGDGQLRHARRTRPDPRRHPPPLPRLLAQQPGRMAAPRRVRHRDPVRRPRCPRRPTDGLPPDAPVPGAPALPDPLPAGRRPPPHHTAARRQGIPRHRGQPPPRRHRGGTGAGRGGHRPGQSTHAVHTGRRPGRHRPHRPRPRGRHAASLTARPPHRPGVRRHRRAGGPLRQRWRDDPAGHRADPRRRRRQPAPDALTRRLVGDDQRRRTRPGPVGGTGSRPPAAGLVPVRLARTVRVGRRQPPGRHDAHRGGQRPGPDRRPAGDAVDQHRTAGRSVRPGQRLLRAGADLFGLRGPARLRDRCPALARRPRRGGTAVVARQDRLVQRDPDAVRPGHVVPALGDRHRARCRRGVRAQLGRPGPPPHRAGRRPPGATTGSATRRPDSACWTRRPRRTRSRPRCAPARGRPWSGSPGPPRTAPGSS